MDFKKLIEQYKECPCGQKHECAVGDIRIGSGITAEAGDILTENNFPRRILVVADKVTIEAAEGIRDALKDYSPEYLIYDSLRVATMTEVRRVKSYFSQGIEAVLAVGTGSVHDVCRKACAEADKKLCLYATAPSMDGFASYSAPIVDNNFKVTYEAKCPEVIIADTRILSKSPIALKSAGFGDMMAKYVALIDWKVSRLITGESYCSRVADLTRYATDAVFAMADKVTADDEETAKKIFEGLLLTGIAMSFTKTSRPGSGTEHIMAHYIECKELLEDKTPNYHGEDVGVTTLLVLKLYDSILNVNGVNVFPEKNDWAQIEKVYGPLASEMKKLNMPDTITDNIDPAFIKENFDKIKEIVKSVPRYEEVLQKMKIAGCKTTYQEIGKPESLIKEAFLYHPYMRRRLSLRRLLNMTDVDPMRIFDNSAIK
ncbi:MAG: iron-containing alcohol dehydrogenase [Clostridia bacterium]|nr:iron-containing alcohol dehydrogenase [Clostridia bacterium]